MATNRFCSKTNLQTHKSVNAETQLLGYIAWQWDRYIVPQNVFLVFHKKPFNARNVFAV